MKLEEMNPTNMNEKLANGKLSDEELDAVSGGFTDPEEFHELWRNFSKYRCKFCNGSNLAPILQPSSSGEPEMHVICSDCNAFYKVI